MAQAKIIALASSKGGVGKTTVAMALAGEFAHRGLQVALLDADPNAPLVRWSSGAHAPSAISVVGCADAHQLDAAIEDHRASADVVLVDAEGSMNHAMAVAVGRADLTLTPLQASKLDAEEAAKVVALVKRLRASLGAELRHALLFSRVSAAVRDRSYTRVKAVFAAHQVPSLETELVDRTAFKAAFDHGATLRTLPEGAVTNTAKAIANVEALADEVGRLVGLEALEAVS